jgi:hypothetical protein
MGGKAGATLCSGDVIGGRVGLGLGWRMGWGVLAAMESGDRLRVENAMTAVGLITSTRLRGSVWSSVKCASSTNTLRMSQALSGEVGRVIALRIWQS